MTTVAEKETDAASLEYAAYTFKCAACEVMQKFSIKQVYALPEGGSVNCTSCEVSLKASPGDRDVMQKHFDKQDKFYKSIVIFCAIWCVANILVLVLYGGPAAGAMSLAGVFIFMGVKSSVNEDVGVFVLEVAGAD